MFVSSQKLMLIDIWYCYCIVDLRLAGQCLLHDVSGLRVPDCGPRRPVHHLRLPCGDSPPLRPAARTQARRCQHRLLRHAALRSGPRVPALLHIPT